MSDVNLATKSDLASLFQELEDAAKHAKIENKENKIKTESQVKELDSFLTSVQEVVKVIDETPKKEITLEEPKAIQIADIVTEEPILETKSLSTEDEDKLGAFAGLMSSFGAILDAPPEVEDTDTLKLQVEDIYPKVVTQEEEDNKLEALQNLFSSLVEVPRIPRKKGQPAGSDSHSDLYTDENPKGTIRGLKFATVSDAQDSVKKIEGSGKTHAHKIQAAIAMEQRAKEMGKTAEAGIYRAYIEKMKKITKQKNEEIIREEIKKSDLDQIEKYADRIFASLNIDVEFTRHFLDRVNDKRNVKQITSAELTRLFKQSYKKYGKKIAQLGPDAEAVISDMKTNINMPFVLNLKGQELELVAKTVMRKKDFKTSGPKLRFENFNG